VALRDNAGLEVLGCLLGRVIHPAATLLQLPS
jgi:hypothetical protein